MSFLPKKEASQQVEDLLRVRSTETSVVLAFQSENFAHPFAKNNASNIAVLKLSDPQEAKGAAGMLGQEGEAYQRIMSLKKGEAIWKIAGDEDVKELVFPPIVQGSYPTDVEVTEFRNKQNQKIWHLLQFREPGKPAPIDYLALLGEKPLHAFSELRHFLRTLKKYSDKPITYTFKAINAGGSKGERLLHEALENKLIIPAGKAKGKGRPGNLYRLTDDGETFIREDK